VPAFGLPAINTVILLSSSVTVTIAHHALRAGHRGVLKFWLAATFILGFSFVALQAHEYGEAYRELGLRLSTGIYGSTFFMLTGFHGLHVTIGAIMLTIIWLRTLKATSHLLATLLRGGVVVLALCRRGVVGVVYFRLLAVSQVRSKQLGDGASGLRKKVQVGRACGVASPVWPSEKS